MSDNEEGFANEQATQIIQYNYKPSSRAWTTITKKNNTMFKKSNHQLTLITCNPRIINDSIHSQWVEYLYALSKPKNVVFSSGVKNQAIVQENNLTFQSEFESGNMEIISRIKSNEYDLYMKPDSNTKNHFQWFNFKVSIRRANKTIKFTIKNFIKSTMLYSQGLKPYCRSLKNPEYHQFRQIDSPVKFYEDLYTDCYSLEFSYHFQFDSDEVEFCSQPPYTITHLNKFMDTLKCKKLILGKTVLGNKIPYLLFEARKETKAVVVAIARQHPGQAVGSWMMQGFINQLNEQNLNQFISWYVIPIINVDGVILGNNRTGVLGHDFNRNWIVQQTSNSKYNKLFPETQSVVSLIKNLKRKFPRKVKMFLDLHGHSSQPNVFSYGPPHQFQSEYFYQCRLFPELISRKNSNFKLYQCSYVLHPEKKKTARSVIFYNLGIPFTYTIESTFGVMNQKNVVTDDFIKVGADVALSAFQFITPSICKQNIQGLNNLIEDIKQKYQNGKCEGEEFDSASQASDENPNRKKIQQLVILGQQQLSKTETDLPKKCSKRYQQIKRQIIPEFEHKFKSLSKSNTLMTQQQRSLSTSNKRSEKKRIMTEGELILNRKQCIFPNISTRNSKMAFDQMSFLSNQQIIQNLKIGEIQKKLQKLRNSKIGKKILVINAYCS